MAIERYEREDFELYINTETGEVFSSQSALVRMLSDIPVPRTTLRDFGNGRNMGMKRVEAPTNKGFRMVRVYTEDEMLEVFEHFDSPLLKQCAKCGLRVYLHRLAGFQVISTAVQPIDSTNQLLLRVLANQEEQANFFNSQIAEMRLEMQQQNERLMLLLPDHEMMNSIREAIDDLENLKPILEAISQSIKDNPCQPHHPLKYYLANKKCGRGLRIRIGQMVSGWLALSKGCKLSKLNGFQNSANLYPECAFPLIVLAWQICTA